MVDLGPLREADLQILSYCDRGKYVAVVRGENADGVFPYMFRKVKGETALKRGFIEAKGFSELSEKFEVLWKEFLEERRPFWQRAVRGFIEWVGG